VHLFGFIVRTKAAVSLVMSVSSSAWGVGVWGGGNPPKIKIIFFLILHQRFLQIQGDQKVSVHLMITIHKSGAQRRFDHLVFLKQIQVLFTV